MIGEMAYPTGLPDIAAEATCAQPALTDVREFY